MAGETKCNPCDATGLAANYRPDNCGSDLAGKSIAFQDILNPLYAE